MNPSLAGEANEALPADLAEAVEVAEDGEDFAEQRRVLRPQPPLQLLLHDEEHALKVLPSSFPLFASSYQDDNLSLGEILGAESEDFVLLGLGEAPKLGAHQRVLGLRDGVEARDDGVDLLLDTPALTITLAPGRERREASLTRVMRPLRYLGMKSNSQMSTGPTNQPGLSRFLAGADAGPPSSRPWNGSGGFPPDVGSALGLGSRSGSVLTPVEEAGAGRPREASKARASATAGPRRPASVWLGFQERTPHSSWAVADSAAATSSATFQGAVENPDCFKKRKTTLPRMSLHWEWA